MLASEIKVTDIWGPVYINNTPIISIEPGQITVGHNAEYLFGTEVSDILEDIQGPFIVKEV